MYNLMSKLKLDELKCNTEDKSFQGIFTENHLSSCLLFLFSKIFLIDVQRISNGPEMYYTLY